MPTSRKRSSGFSSAPVEDKDEVIESPKETELEELVSDLDAVVEETITLPPPVVEEIQIPPTPQVVPSKSKPALTPSVARQPVVEEIEEIKIAVEPVRSATKSKRSHPRNIPRFSPYK